MLYILKYIGQHNEYVHFKHLIFLKSNFYQCLPLFPRTDSTRRN